MVKITILSEKKGKYYHNILIFYDFKGKAINECECGKFIYYKHYNPESKTYKERTTMFDHDELAKLKKTLEAI